MALIITIVVFIGVMLLFVGSMDLLDLYKHGDSTKARERMSLQTIGVSAEETVEIIRKDALDQGSFFDSLQEKFAPIANLQTLLVHADSDMPVSVFFLISAVLGVLAFVAALLYGAGSTGIAMSVAGGFYLPFAYYKRQRKLRLQQIEAQLPDALDLIARTLQAGHAFMMGMKLVGEQMDAPIGPEFQKTFDEVNFGISVAEAMTGMSKRVDTLDIKFFVTSLIVQLETGGNLAEIIQSISKLTRQRFELQGKVRALSAEGKISAGIMFALPIVVGLALWMINPDYVGLLVEDPMGVQMLQTGAGMMAVGLWITNRMIQIAV